MFFTDVFVRIQCLGFHVLRSQRGVYLGRVGREVGGGGTVEISVYVKRQSHQRPGLSRIVPD